MVYLFENPTVMVMVGLVLLTFSGVLYYSTKSVGSFVATVIIAVLLLCGLVMEQLVFTPREMVEATVSGICDAAEANDIERVRAFLAPSATETRKMVDSIMPRVEVEKANVFSEMEIDIDDPKNPKKATVRFEGFFQGKLKSSSTPGAGRFPVTVELIWDGQRWLIESFRSDRDFEREAAKLMN